MSNQRNVLASNYLDATVPGLREQVAFALAEDIGSGDLTASLVPASTRAQARVITRDEAVICGTAWFDEVFRQLDPSIEVTWHCIDGQRMKPNALLCELEGPARTLLTGERSALNFLQTLSGTATITRRYVDAIANTGCRILDTRKTLPGLRRAQKYAVLCGGGTNHRIGLFDAILVKENHIISAGSIAAAVAQARTTAEERMVEIEVENLDELEQALKTDIDRILLDNFSLDDLVRAVKIKIERKGYHVQLEASGNVSLETIRDIAKTGVDFVSVGGLTKHVQAVDLSMRFAFSDAG
ncbi:MAG: carboxylating nicotinate-nucleotide diphosphorylase [Steroidobacteraceae bacterium]